MVAKYEDGLIVLDYAQFGNWTQFGNGTRFGDWARFGDNNQFGDETQFRNRTQVGDDTQFGDNTQFGDWTRFGNGTLFGIGCTFEGLKFHEKERQYYIKIDNIGSRFAETYFFNSINGIYVRSGCFFGSESDFLEKVEETHGHNVHSIEYITAIDYVKNIFKKRMEAYNE